MKTDANNAQRRTIAANLSAPISETDPAIFEAMRGEHRSDADSLCLIASRNYASRAVMEALGSVLVNTVSEGYPDKRYHAGAANIDRIEQLAIHRAKELYSCAYANVQPHSGSQANQAVMLACVKPGDTILSMALSAGGHLSHGAKPNLVGKWFNVVQYGVDAETGLIDYDEIDRLAAEHQPKLIIAGGSSYPRFIDFERIGKIAKRHEAFSLADVSHISGPIITGACGNPAKHMDFVTTTTRKNLHGPKGGLILSDNLDLGKRINSAIFPGLQGGQFASAVAAKAVCLGEALTPEYKEYVTQTLTNAKKICEVLQNKGYPIVTGGTDTFLLLVDLRAKGLTGNMASATLERAGLPCNMNMIPNDPEKPSVTSGLRIGAAAMTTRGLGLADIETVARLIGDVLDSLVESPDATGFAEATCRQQVAELCVRYPLYEHLI